MRAGRGIARLVGWVAAGAVAGMLAAVVVPLAFDARPYTVLSGSMEPAIAAGDLVVAERTSPRDVRLGDVVTFEDPQRGGRPTTHRVGGIRRVAGKFELVTKGDANDATERWRVAAGGDLGRVAYRIPWIGNVTVLARRPLGFALIVALPLLLLAVNELARIWRPPSAKGEHATGA